MTSLIDFAIGRMMPPERAVTEGIAGAITRSAQPSEYAIPVEEPPNFESIRYAIRRPRPDWTKPSDKTYAEKIIHTVPDARPESDWLRVSVPEK